MSPPFRKVRDFGNRGSMASHFNKSIFFRSKERRGEISETEPASPFDLAHLKRPSSSNACESGKSLE